jgi:malate permease and related proteins
MDGVIFILILLASGWILRQLRARPSTTEGALPAWSDWPRIFPDNTAKVLTQFILFVSLPALILVQIPRTDFTKDVFVVVAMPWLILFLSSGLVWVVAYWRGWSRAITGALLLLVPLGNTSFFGVPMVEAFLGKEMVPYALVYDQLGTFLALATYGAVVVALYSDTTVSCKAPLNWKVMRTDIVCKIVGFPPLQFLIIAFAIKFSGWSYPDMATTMLESLAATVVPLAIIAVGLQIKPFLDREALPPLGFGLVVKLCIAPLLAIGLCKLFGWTGPTASLAIFEAGMPSQIGAWAVSMAAGFDQRVAAPMVGFGIVISLVTLSLLAYVL